MDSTPIKQIKISPPTPPPVEVRSYNGRHTNFDMRDRVCQKLNLDQAKL